MAAGGMGRRGGPTLAERSATSGVAADPPRRRHCWVAAPGDGSGPRPGLVVEWERDDHGWRARVVYVVGDDDSATTVETWVDAAHLRPA